MPALGPHERTQSCKQAQLPASRVRRKCRSGPGDGLLATKPRDLERFIDSYSGMFGGVEARASRATLATSYDASISWDGLAVDPRPFARFDEHNTITLTKRPAGAAGARVIELEGHPPGGIFGRPATGPGRMQWTVEQETSRVLAADNPFRKAAADGGSVAVERPYFNSTLMVVPKVEAVRPPTCMPRAGHQGNGALLTPEERRQMNDYESKMQTALGVGRKARYQKTRLDFILRHRYPEGAIGVDSPSNPASEVHLEKRLDREEREASSSAQASARRQRLNEIRGNPHCRFGYNPWQHPDLPAGGGIQHGISRGVTPGGCDGASSRPVGRNGGEHFLQAKARIRRAHQAQALPAARSQTKYAPDNQHPDTTTTTTAPGEPSSNTYLNIFGARDRVPKSDPNVRSQKLWDEWAGRRRYDVVSGARLPVATQMAERSPGRLAHPSQQSLERGRNLQGSLVPA